MPRPANLIPTRALNVMIPLPELTKVALQLNSELEGRVPHGAYSRFFVELIRAHFEEAQFDLGPYLGADFPAGVYVVRGPKETISALERKLT